MKKNKVPLYWNKEHTKYGVLVSHGFGAGWSSWEGPTLAYDGRVIDCWIKNNDEQEVADFIESLGYDRPYMGGWKNCQLEWIPENTLWRITEYDGAEQIEFFSPSDWNHFIYEEEVNEK